MGYAIDNHLKNMHQTIHAEFSPSEFTIKVIEGWLKNEFENYGTGFYSNLGTIKECFSEGRLIALSLNDEIVGFTTYLTGEKHLEIGIFEIEPRYRKKGFGKYFIDEIAKYWAKNLVAIILFCEPQTSESFWQKMEFIKFPELDYLHELTYYKPIIPYSESISNADSENKIELWNLEPYQVKSQSPTWSWNIPNDKNRNPIVQACDGDWLIRITKNGRLMYNGKAKRVNNKKLKIYFCPFLFIQAI